METSEENTIDFRVTVKNEEGEDIRYSDHNGKIVSYKIYYFMLDTILHPYKI